MTTQTVQRPSKKTHSAPTKGAAIAPASVTVEWVKATNRPDLLTPGQFVHNKGADEGAVVIFASENSVILSSPRPGNYTADRDYAGNVDELWIPIVSGADVARTITAAPPAPIQEHPDRPDLIEAIRHVERAGFILVEICDQKTLVYINGKGYPQNDDVLVKQVVDEADALEKRICEIIINVLMQDVGGEREAARERAGGAA